MTEARVYERLCVADVAERVVDAERIGRILGGLGRDRASGSVLRAGAPIGLVTAVTQRPHAGNVLWNYQGLAWSGTAQAQIASRLSLYRFGLELVECVDGRLVTSSPRFIERIRTRGERRVRPPPGVMLRFRDAQRRPEARPLEDVSHRGLRFRVAAGEELHPGMELCHVVIDWCDRLAARARLLVRHVSAAEQDGCAVAGVSLEFESRDDLMLYRAEIDALVSADTRTGASFTRDLFELFEKSGYFELSSRSPSEFLELARAFQGASQKLSATPELGLQVVWPSGRGVEAASAVVALHGRAAFLYHVAKRRGGATRSTGGRVILHAVYERALSWIRGVNAMRWLVVWVQDQSSFPKRLHLDFVTRQTDSSAASVVSFRALEFSSDAGDASSSDADFACRGATADDAPPLAVAAREQFPSSFLEAHALFADDAVDFERWRLAALRRGREMVVAERNGQRVAAMLLEYGEDGVHLFNLFDVVWFIPLAPSAEAALGPLLGYAKRFYRGVGKRSFYLAHDPHAARASWPVGAVDRAHIHCTVMSTALLPDFAEHTWELTIGAAG